MHTHVSDALSMHYTSDRPIVGSAMRHDRYPVYVCRDEDATVSHIAATVAGRRVAMITDDMVADLHGNNLAKSLTRSGIEVSTISFASGEASKSLTTAFQLLDWLAESAIVRRDIILAVGGGVVIDTVGWVASAYMRGIPYVNVPTTLLAHVDAALGGKVAVDHRNAKNLIGAFYQPKAVVSNVSYISTLDDRQIRAGLAEAVKKGVIASPELFTFIENNTELLIGGDLEALENLVRGASAIKCELIARDPYEEDLRRPLNFGHTVGHAVETVTGYGPVLHGEAVAFGMVVATEISRTRGLVTDACYRRITGLIHRTGLPTRLTDLPVPVDVRDVVGALDKIRAIRDGRIRFVLPVDLGETAIADDVTDDEIARALSSTRQGF